MFGGQLAKFLRIELVHIEKQELEFQTGAQVNQALLFRDGVSLEKCKIVSAGALQQLRFAGLKLDDLGVFRGHEDKGQLRERAESGEFFRARVGAPHLGQFTFAVGLFKKVARQHGQTVEQSLGGPVGLRKIELHGVLVQLVHRDGLIVQNQQVPLRRVEIFVEV